MKDLKASLEKLYALKTFGIKPGLETEERLLERLGHPERGLAAIHVAGTNGKGSVCAMLDSILRAAGFKVGLYTSPHLVRFNERIRVNGECIADADLAELFEALEPHAAAVAAEQGGREVTFFEFTTALAFEHFRRKGIRLAVIEVGMGGRLDATNVITPLLSVITRISLEHTQYLGRTLAAIAGEKAGIIKPGRPVVCGANPEEADEVFRSAAAERGSDLVRAEDAATVRRVSQRLGGQKVSVATEATPYGTVTLPLLGPHQLENCATAVAAVEALAAASGLAVPPAAVLKGLAAVRWPARLQVLQDTPPVLLDSAHNPDGARVLAGAIKELFRKQPVGLIWGMCDDKDTAGFAAALPRTIKRCWTVPIPTERSVPPEQLALLVRGRGWAVTACALPQALAEAEAWARENGGAVCVAGSLFLAGAVLAEKKIAV
jgi:dihydrofolate synthase / folylpolyglutamate synthase